MPSMDRREAREAARALLHLQAQLRCALYGCGTGRLAQAGHPAPLSAAGEEALARAVMRVRVAAFLHPALEAGRVPVRLPAEYPGLCRQAYFGVLRRNLVLLDVGEALLRRLAQAGVPASARGPWAWLRGTRPIYDDPGRRPVDALVLEVGAGARPAARELAKELGFVRKREPSSGASRVPTVGGPRPSDWMEKRVGGLELALELREDPSLPAGAKVLVDVLEGLERSGMRRGLALLDLDRLLAARGPSVLAALESWADPGTRRAARTAVALAHRILATPLPRGQHGLVGSSHRPPLVPLPSSPRNIALR